MSSSFKPHVTFKSQVHVKRYKPHAKPTDVGKSRKKAKSEEAEPKANREKGLF